MTNKLLETIAEENKKFFLTSEERDKARKFEIEGKFVEAAEIYLSSPDTARYAVKLLAFAEDSEETRELYEKFVEVERFRGRGNSTEVIGGYMLAGRIDKAREFAEERGLDIPTSDEMKYLKLFR